MPALKPLYIAAICIACVRGSIKPSIWADVDRHEWVLGKNEDTVSAFPLILLMIAFCFCKGNCLIGTDTLQEIELVQSPHEIHELINLPPEGKFGVQM